MKIGQTFMRSLSHTWDGLTRPSAAIQEPDRRRQARLLASLLALLLVLAWLSILQRVFTNLDIPLWQDTNFYVILFTTVVLLLPYSLSRTRHYKWAVVLTCVLLSALIFTAAIPDREANEIFFLDYLVLTVFFASMLLSLRTTSLLIAVHLAGLGLFPFLVQFPGLTATEVYIGPLSFNLILSPLILLGAYHGGQLEKDRQAMLRAKNEEIKAVSQQLWQTAKLATLGELAASVAHEINNPLTTASLRVESLLTEVSAHDPKFRELKIIEHEIGRVTKLVSDLVEFSQRDRRRPSSLDVRDELEKSLELVQAYLRDRQVSVITEIAANLPPLQADRQLLRQVFLNLLTNAGEAMPTGGRLTVRATTAKSEEAPAQASAPTQIVIEITDTGAGIPKEVLARVWETFFTTKSEGHSAGLGLAICRRIVEEHGGTIHLDSQVSQGTRVHVTFPVNDPSYS